MDVGSAVAASAGITIAALFASGALGSIPTDQLELKVSLQQMAFGRAAALMTFRLLILVATRLGARASFGRVPHMLVSSPGRFRSGGAPYVLSACAWISAPTV